MIPELQNSLERAGRSHVRHRVLGIVLKAIPWAVGLLVLCFAIDIIAHLPAGAREWIRNGLIIMTVLLLGAALAVALLRHPPVLRTARMIEDRLPELDSRLINILQLESQVEDPDKSEVTRQLARRAVDDAARDLPMAKFAPAVRPPQLVRKLVFAALVPALLVVVTLVCGEPGAREWARFLDPHGDHPPISFTRLAIIDPAEDGYAVPFRDAFRVTVEAGGHRPKEVFLTGVTEEGVNLFTLPMAQIEKGKFGVRVEDVREPLYVYAHTEGESALSTRRHIDVILEPRIERAWVTVEPPAYTGQPSQKMPFGFNGLRALEGGMMKFEIESNRPLGPGRIVYEIPGKDPQEFPLVPEEADSVETVIGNVPALATGRLVFHIEDVDGRAAGETPSTSVTVTHDAEPAVSLLFPTEDTFVVETMTIELIAEAADDIGLRSMRLHTGIDGEFSEPETVRFDPPGETRHRIKRKLDLPALGLKAGQTITVFADALDGAPDPHFSKTEQRTLTLITEDQYNEALRREADVALIAGKYEAVLERLREAVEEQKAIEEQLAAAKELPPEEATAEVGEAFQRQQNLNKRLEGIARDMRDVTRDNPVYDFEKDLAESLAERAEEIENSVEQNRQDVDEALKESAAGEPVKPEEREALEKAAREQKERLAEEQQQAEEQVQQPLEDLADFHEMLKNFNQLRNLAEEQRQLAEEAAAADRGQEQLTPEDKAALRDLANRERQLGQRLEQLQEKLRQDAERMRDKMPEMAEAAEQLADQLEHNGLPGQARDAAGEMLEGDAAGANQQAQRLKEQLEEMLGGQPGQGGQPGDAPGEQAAGERLAQLLQGFGMRPGNNFQQMLQSLRFTPPGMGMAQGGAGMGMGGMQAQGMMDGNPQAMLGGESLKGGDIARRLSGMGGGQGMGGGPGEAVESTELAAEDIRSSRRTDTPESATLMMEYEDVADAYFDRLTTPNP
ncbi:glutamyl-tRNA synthetase [Haloferula helveola]|uniref:Glutamyl-tRNA synthetase n=1 Tax=Haloferula helveola TaxID=490095 RepID=A0ABN6H1H5_9BACT|nr:glutamyl-tRNA synthetase [Haloferula helveola]